MITLQRPRWTATTGTRPRSAAWPAVLGALAVVLLAGAGTRAVAAVPDGASGHYATFDVTGASGAWHAATAVDAAGFPTAAVTSTSTSVTAPSGASAFLGAGTPFGARFGSSRGRPYLSADSASGRTPSATTVTFAGPTPAAGWGFALGDVDADAVRITATDAAGTVLSGAALTAALGWQGAFNFCADSPRPSSCTGGGPFTDVPTWDPATATLTGSGTNTFGASGWFEPTVALRSMTFTFSVQVGSPNYQIWLAALSVPVSGTVEGASDETPGVAVELRDTDGTPVRDPAGDPVAATVDGSGRFQLPAVVDGDYVLHLDPGDDAAATGPLDKAISVDVDQGPTVVPDGTFAVRPTGTASTTPPPSTSSSPPPSSAPATSGTTSGTTTSGATGLAATGARPGRGLLLGSALLAAGALLTVSGRRRGRRPRH